MADHAEITAMALTAVAALISGWLADVFGEQ